MELSRTSSPETTVTEHVPVCGDLLLHTEEVQFRWMGFRKGGLRSLAYLDVWGLSNVTARWFRDNVTSTVLFRDTFGSPVLK